MREPGYGGILGIVSGAGLFILLMGYVYLRLNPPPGPGPAYDQVFKYCTDAYQGQANDGDPRLQNDPLYAQVTKLQPGDYPTGKSEGHIYLFGQGMFEVELPSQLQVVRPLSGVNSWTDSDRPRMVIGCTDAALVRVLQAYGLRPETEVQSLANGRKS